MNATGIMVARGNACYVRVMADNFYIALGRRVADLRNNKGMTQEELAEHAMIGTAYVSRIESGTRKPTLDVVNAMAAALGVPIWRFFAEHRLSVDELGLKAMSERLAKLVDGLPADDLDALARVAEQFRKLRGLGGVTRRT